jgi:hypothetical protein
MKEEEIKLLDALTKRIPAMRAAFSLMPLDQQELDATRKAWAEVLLGQVPAMRVEEMFILAMRIETNSGEKRRTVTAPDILQIWRAVHREEVSRKRRSAVKFCDACCNTKKVKVYSREHNRNVLIDCPYHPPYTALNKWSQT